MAKIKVNKGLGVFSLAMLNVAAIISLRNLPLIAELGLAAIFFLIIAAMVFFIPIALATAELAAAWPTAGGNYIWVAEAFGKPMGFFALWVSWMESISWFPIILAFTAVMLAHVLAPVFPNLENSNIFILGMVLLIFWLATIVNLFGINVSGWISTLGVVLGTLIPGVLIILFGLWWIFSGHVTEVPLTWGALVPEFKLNNVVIFAGVLLSLAGIELAAFHVSDAKNPQKDYPLAVLISSLIILVLYILGTLAILVVVPKHQLSLASGVIQAIQIFFGKFAWFWATPLLAMFLLIGALAGINTWIIGPAKGMLVVVKDGFLPAILKSVNNKGVPVALLLLQAGIGSVLALVFLYLQDSNGAMWILTALSAQFTFLQYLLVFAAIIKLRYTKATVFRPYKMPAVWLLSLIGIIASVFSFFIVYIPPLQINTGDANWYRWLLLGALGLLSLPPMLLTKFCYKKTG